MSFILNFGNQTCTFYASAGAYLTLKIGVFLADDSCGNNALLTSVKRI